MSSSVIEVRPPLTQRVEVTKHALIIDLTDGRSLTVPLAWYPRLALGTTAERAKWRLIGTGEGIHWPDLDEDISTESLLAGRPSGEGKTSLQKWLKSRAAPANGQRQRTAHGKAKRRR